MYGDGQGNVGVAIESTTNVMMVEFKSDDSVEYDGFSALFGQTNKSVAVTPAPTPAETEEGTGASPTPSPTLSTPLSGLSHIALWR